VKTNTGAVWQSKIRRKLNWAYVLLYDEMLGFLWSEETVRLLGKFERTLRRTFPDQEELRTAFNKLVDSAELLDDNNDNSELGYAQNLRYAVENMRTIIEQFTPQANYILLTNNKEKI